MNDDEGPTPIDAVRELTAYTTPTHDAPIDLDLSGNLGPAPPPAVTDALAELDGQTLRAYPGLGELRGAIAAHHGLDRDRVLVTAGGDQAIDVVVRAYLDDGRRLCIHSPSFVMIERAARLAGAEVAAVAWPGGAFPTDAFLETAADGCDLAILVSPNNPTGAEVAAADLERIATALSSGLLVVDHAYVEYGDSDLTPLVADHDNVAVIRTLSKAYGLAGARVGYLIGHPQVVSYLERIRSPYPLSAPSIAAATARLGVDAGIDSHVEAVRRHREALESHLADLGVSTTRSRANFVLGTFPDARWAFDGLSGLGIRTRLFPDRDGLEDCLRISVPADADDRRRLADALAATVAPEAVLLDMDGVVANVSDSYRTAIVRTAADYGVDIDHAAIEARKQAGDANDDWALTQAILADAGVEVDYAAVRDAFEAHYQGTGGDDGLYTREQLVGGEALAALAQRRPIGVVTGRPRPDASRFVADHDIEDHIDVLVCKEDAADKPDPAPVELALERLGVAHAWLVGDTPDDVCAARRAGVVPIGIIPPGADSDDVAPTLTDAGAARVVDELADVVMLLGDATTG